MKINHEILTITEKMSLYFIKKDKVVFTLDRWERLLELAPAVLNPVVKAIRGSVKQLSNQRTPVFVSIKQLGSNIELRVHGNRTKKSFILIPIDKEIQCFLIFIENVY
jgi:hypothetical protein